MLAHVQAIVILLAAFLIFSSACEAIIAAHFSFSPSSF